MSPSTSVMTAPESRTAYLGIESDDLAIGQVVDYVARARIERFVSIVTPNVDHLVRLHRGADSGLLAAYAGADLILNDSQVLYLLSKPFRLGIRHVVRGSDLVPMLLESDSIRDVLVIGPPAAAAARLKAAYPDKRFRVHTPPMGVRVGDEHFDRLVAEASDERHDLVLVCLGCPVSENALQRLMGVRRRGAAICCGAAIDFLTGAQKRAPETWRRLGLEWLYRALDQPGRLGARYASNLAGLARMLARRTVSGRLRRRDLW